MVARVSLTGVTSSETTSKARVLQGPEDLTSLGLTYVYRAQERFARTPNGDIVWPMYDSSDNRTLRIARLSLAAAAP